MANEEHLAILKKGVMAWNKWRTVAPGVNPDLSGADLRGWSLAGANFSRMNLTLANLTDANLSGASLSRTSLNMAMLMGANLHRADLQQASLIKTNLNKANLTNANLSQAFLLETSLSGTDLTEANLSEADMGCAALIETNLERAILTGCTVYGISAWDVRLTGAVQENLRISRLDRPTITVDNLELAQFMNLLLNNERIRHVIDTITSKVVLILGRFTPERKIVLDALRQQLRARDYLPVLFDFDKPASRDITETVSTLAHMARFVIADITDAKSIPQELSIIIPSLPSVPVQPLLLSSQHEYGMFEHFRRYPWVLPIYLYDDQETLLRSLDTAIIAPAVEKAQELQSR
jgi:uncharacterized protein YjbI with pentapeptide repeats